MFAGISDEGCRHIVHSLRGNTTLKLLNLLGNNISETGGRYVSDTFCRMNDTVISLNLDCNALGPYGCQYIAEILRSNTAIEELYLSYNGIGDEGVEYLSESVEFNTTLKCMTLDHNQLSREGKERIARAVHRNPHLNLVLKL